MLGLGGGVLLVPLLTVFFHQPIQTAIGASVFAGVISGLLGIGGGPIQVPIMRLVMGLPIKAAVGTSNFLVGTTVVASAFIYYERGYVDPLVAVPTTFAVFVGAQVGSRIARRIHGAWLSLVFAALLGYLALQMLLRAFDVGLF